MKHVEEIDLRKLIPYHRENALDHSRGGDFTVYQLSMLRRHPHHEVHPKAHPRLPNIHVYSESYKEQPMSANNFYSALFTATISSSLARFQAITISKSSFVFGICRLHPFLSSSLCFIDTNNSSGHKGCRLDDSASNSKSFSVTKPSQD
jgi:hypothetical protein